MSEIICKFLSLKTNQNRVLFILELDQFPLIFNGFSSILILINFRLKHDLRFDSRTCQHLARIKLCEKLTKITWYRSSTKDNVYQLPIKIISYQFCCFNQFVSNYDQNKFYYFESDTIFINFSLKVFITDFLVTISSYQFSI